MSAPQETWKLNTPQIHYMVTRINIYSMTSFSHIDEFISQGVDFEYHGKVNFGIICSLSPLSLSSLFWYSIQQSARWYLLVIDKID